MIPFPIATKQKCDIQQFYSDSAWNKPVGVSHVYMLLIGGGGTGNGTNGGASGSVSVWYGAAQNVPDSLRIQVGKTLAIASSVFYLGSSGTPVTLFTAASPSSNGVAGAQGANYFTNSGFFTATNGQAGGSTISASGVTFLSGGANTGTALANYGYKTANSGYFQLQPIIVGTGGVFNGVGGIGCGGGANSAQGGNGFVLIASW
jgi:hypothetical protein